jgi:hypothetical protein
MVTTKANSSQETKVPKDSNELSDSELQELADFVDPRLFDPQHDRYRQSQFSYGIVVNENPAGIFIPLDQLEAVEWKQIPSKLDTYTPGSETIQGVLLTRARCLVFYTSPSYLTIKQRQKGESGVIGLFEDMQASYDKTIHSRCEDYYCVFLDQDNAPLHDPNRPLKINFKNVSRASLSTSLRDYYRGAESLFAKMFSSKLKQSTPDRLTGKSDQWRACLVVEVAFKAEKVGEGSNRSWCCKVDEITKLTPQNFRRLFMGSASSVDLITEVYTDQISGLKEGYTATALLPPSSTDEIPMSAANPSKSAETGYFEVDAIEVDGLDDLD